MGLPRSNLIKSKSSGVAPFVAPIPAPAPVAPSPFEAANTLQAVPAPFSFAPVSNASPFTTTAPLPFGAFVAPLPPSSGGVGDSTMREALHTNPDGIDVEVSPVSRPLSPGPARAPYPSSISANELLERAAAMGPARMTWESIVLRADPVLDEKRQPHVAERRERFTRMVKIGLGACLAVCVVAIGVSAVSGDASSSSASASSSSLRTVPAKAVVPIEALEGTKHGKAARRVTAPAAAVAIVRPKRR